MDFTSLTPQQILDLAKRPREFQEAVENLKLPSIDFSDQANALAKFRGYAAHAEKQDRQDPEVGEETLYAPARDGCELLLKVFRSATALAKDGDESTSPLIVLFFGGGFVLGSPTSMANLARSLVKRLNAVVVAPTYRLAPEHPFPTGMNDGYDAITWIAKNARTLLRANPARGFIVGGISSGGSIANVSTHLARDGNLQPRITGNWLSCPPVRLAPKDADRLPQKYRERLLSRTQQECIDCPILTPPFRKLIDDMSARDENSELASPMMWTIGHKGMPKTYSQVCGMDVGRDELLIYNDMLKSEGVETKVDLWPGLPHVFWSLFKQLPQAQRWEEDTLNGFAWLLSE